MFKHFLIIVGLLLSIHLNAQTGIGTTTPHPSAKFEVAATDKGFLPPRLALTGANVASPVTSPANGLMVFNTTTAGLGANQVVPGYYYWNSTSGLWIKLDSDNLGNHTANVNILLNGNFLSNDGDNEGIRIDNTGNVGIGTSNPTARLNISGGGIKIASGLGNASNRPNLTTTSIGNYEIRGVGGGTPQIDAQDDGFLRLSAGGGSNVITQSSIDISGYSTVADMSNNILIRTGGSERIRINSIGNVGIGTNTPAEKLEINGNVKANNFLGTASSVVLYLLEAYSTASYSMPGTYTEDPCRYNIVNNTVNIPSSWFNTSTYRFTPQKAGYWEIRASYDVYRNGEAALSIQKNGANVAVAGAIYSVTENVSTIVYLNGSTDYIRIVNNGANANTRTQDASRSIFQARWVGE